MRRIVKSEPAKDVPIASGGRFELSEDDRLFLDTLKKYHLERRYKYMSDWHTKTGPETMAPVQQEA
jgi:hypothetical protein